MSRLSRHERAPRPCVLRTAVRAQFVVRRQARLFGICRRAGTAPRTLISGIGINARRLCDLARSQRSRAALLCNHYAIMCAADCRSSSVRRQVTGPAVWDMPEGWSRASCPPIGHRHRCADCAISRDLRAQGLFAKLRYAITTQSARAIGAADGFQYENGL